MYNIQDNNFLYDTAVLLGICKKSLKISKR